MTTAAAYAANALPYHAHHQTAAAAAAFNHLNSHPSTAASIHHHSHQIPHHHYAAAAAAAYNFSNYAHVNGDSQVNGLVSLTNTNPNSTIGLHDLGQPSCIQDIHAN